MYPQFRHKSHFFAIIFFYFYFIPQFEARGTHVLPRTAKSNIKSCYENFAEETETNWKAVQSTSSEYIFHNIFI